MAGLMRLSGAIALMLAAPTAAQSGASQQASPEDVAAIGLAIDRGELLYEYDQAAWHTTDAMVEDLGSAASTVRGWVVTPQGERLLVTYWKPEGDSFAGVYSAVWTGRDVRDRTVLEGDSARLSEDQLSQIRARQAVDVSGLARCSDAPFNTVIIPSGVAGEVFVYLMTPQTSARALPFGGHYRFTVRDGAVVDQRSFSRSCLEVATQGPEDGDRLVAMTVSHLLDPVPTEVHVFSMLAARKPVYVVTTTNERMWLAEVARGRTQIRLVR